jgi:hypothetical protein
MWTPPTPPHDDNDIYIDQSLCFLYEHNTMPEALYSEILFTITNSVLFLALEIALYSNTSTLIRSPPFHYKRDGLISRGTIVNKKTWRTCDFPVWERVKHIVPVYKAHPSYKIKN